MLGGSKVKGERSREMWVVIERDAWNGLKVGKKSRVMGAKSKGEGKKDRGIVEVLMNTCQQDYTICFYKCTSELKVILSWSEKDTEYQAVVSFSLLLYNKAFICPRSLHS